MGIMGFVCPTAGPLACPKLKKLLQRVVLEWDVPNSSFAATRHDDKVTLEISVSLTQTLTIVFKLLVSLYSVNDVLDGGQFTWVKLRIYDGTNTRRCQPVDNLISVTLVNNCTRLGKGTRWDDFVKSLSADR